MSQLPKLFCFKNSALALFILVLLASVFVLLPGSAQKAQAASYKPVAKYYSKLTKYHKKSGGYNDPDPSLRYTVDGEVGYCYNFATPNPKTSTSTTYKPNVNTRAILWYGYPHTSKLPNGSTGEYAECATQIALWCTVKGKGSSNLADIDRFSPSGTPTEKKKDIIRDAKYLIGKGKAGKVPSSPLEVTPASIRATQSSLSATHLVAGPYKITDPTYLTENYTVAITSSDYPVNATTGISIRDANGNVKTSFSKNSSFYVYIAKPSARYNWMSASIKVTSKNVTTMDAFTLSYNSSTQDIVLAGMGEKTLSDTTAVTTNATYYGLTIRKSANDGNVAGVFGARFKITASNILGTWPAGLTNPFYLNIPVGGSVTQNSLPAATYTINEVIVPDGYLPPPPRVITLPGSTGDGSVVYNAVNIKKTGAISIQKTNLDATSELGLEFKIASLDNTKTVSVEETYTVSPGDPEYGLDPGDPEYGNAYEDVRYVDREVELEAIDTTVTVNADGEYRFEIKDLDPATFPFGRFQVTEVNTPERFQQPEPQILEVSKLDEEYVFAFENKPVTIDLLVEKKAVILDDGSLVSKYAEYDEGGDITGYKDDPEDPAPLVPDTQFAVYRNTGSLDASGAPIWEVWATQSTEASGTPNAGTTTFHNIPYGDYYLAETSQTAGFMPPRDLESNPLRRYFSVKTGVDGLLHETYWNEKVHIGTKIDIATITRSVDGEQYDVTIHDIDNTSNCDSDRTFITGTIDTSHVSFVRFLTGTFDGDIDGYYNFYYRTDTVNDRSEETSATSNEEDEESAGEVIDSGKAPETLPGGYKLWQANLTTDDSVEMHISDLDLSEGEILTGYRYVFGAVTPDFKEINPPEFRVQMFDNASSIESTAHPFIPPEHTPRGDLGSIIATGSLPSPVKFHNQVPVEHSQTNNAKIPDIKTRYPDAPFVPMTVGIEIQRDDMTAVDAAATGTRLMTGFDMGTDEPEFVGYDKKWSEGDDFPDSVSKGSKGSRTDDALTPWWLWLVCMTALFATMYFKLREPKFEHAKYDENVGIWDI